MQQRLNWKYIWWNRNFYILQLLRFIIGVSLLIEAFLSSTYWLLAIAAVFLYQLFRKQRCSSDYCSPYEK